MPSSVRSGRVTIGFFALGFSENPASGSSFGSRTMSVWSEAIFMTLSSRGEPLHCILIQRETKAGLVGQHKLAAVEHRRLVEQLQHPRHVLDGQSIGYRGDQMSVEFGNHMADHR